MKWQAVLANCVNSSWAILKTALGVCVDVVDVTCTEIKN